MKSVFVLSEGLSLPSGDVVGALEMGQPQVRHGDAKVVWKTLCMSFVASNFAMNSQKVWLITGWPGELLVRTSDQTSWEVRTSSNRTSSWSLVVDILR